MLSFSRTTGYAVLALTCIGSWKGQRVLAGQIHKCTGVPMPYLEKILFLLGRHGLVQSKRGHRGGFVLARPAEEISLLDVVFAIEHNKSPTDCVLGLAGCADEDPCQLRAVWPKIWAQIEVELRGITIADAAGSVHGIRRGRLTTCCSPDAAEQPKGTATERANGRKKAARRCGPRVGSP
jgi:Rrf2 family protein